MTDKIKQDIVDCLLKICLDNKDIVLSMIDENGDIRFGYG